MAWPPTTHQDVQDDLTSGHGWATSLAGRLKVGETMLPSPIVVSGRYYGPQAYSSSSTAAAVSGRMCILPFYLPTSGSFDRITVNCSTLAAGATARCGVYASDPTTLLPTTLLADGGAVSGATTGLKETVVSVTLSGLVYFAFVADGATWSAASNTTVPNIFGSATGALGGGAMGLNNDLGAGVTTLPSSLSGVSFIYIGSTSPTGMLRAV